jgi:2,3-bisphosphoglycerate-dependent phosphoglycerate mutase
MLFLIRHAEAAYIPDETRGLTPSGTAAALRVAELLLDREITVIVSSPYQRAIDTVRPLAGRLGIAIDIDDDLRERQLAAGAVDDFERRVEETWMDFDLVHPGGESNTAAQARVSAAIGRIADAAGKRNVAIATHGNALALFLRTIDPAVDYAFWARMSFPDVFAVDTGVESNWSYYRLWR